MVRFKHSGDVTHTGDVIHPGTLLILVPKSRHCRQWGPAMGCSAMVPEGPSEAEKPKTNQAQLFGFLFQA